MLKESTKEFLDSKSPLSSMRELRDNDFQTYDKELWMEMVEMGWTSLTIPEKYNGLNFEKFMTRFSSSSQLKVLWGHLRDQKSIFLLHLHT